MLSALLLKHIDPGVSLHYCFGPGEQTLEGATPLGLMPVP